MGNFHPTLSGSKGLAIAMIALVPTLAVFSAWGDDDASEA
jgi:hypothetical protein